MTDTPRLGLPLLNEAQASPEIKVNLGRYEVDALLQGSVISRALTAPPGGEHEGDAYIPATGATGLWADHVDDVAVFQGGGWRFYNPNPGWALWSLADASEIRFGVAGSPSTWTVVTSSGLTIGLPGSPTLLAPGITTIFFENADVTDLGSGIVVVTPQAPPTRFTRSVSFAGAPVATPVNDVAITIPIDCVIMSVTLLTRGGNGSCVVDIWKDTYANYPPDVTDTITAAAKPTISGGTKYRDSTLTGWVTAVVAGDTLIFHLESSATFTYIGISLELQPT